jgi:molecular chaperone GrpE
MNIEIIDPLSAVPEVETVASEARVLELETLREELARQMDMHLRLAADFENFKRRTRAEAETRATAQKEAFIQELFPAIDNLERALATGVSSASQALHQGVSMTLQHLRNLLQQHGIESDEVVGRPFDPHLHDALDQGHDPVQPAGTILAMSQRGYRRGTKVLRPAKVVVNNLTTPRPGWRAGP